jgi:hypothetical protein
VLVELTSVTVTTHKAEIRMIRFGSQPGKQFVTAYLENTQHNNGLV